MKPIFRWTVGNVSDQGLDILRLSVKKIKKLYDPECIICYNNIDPSKIKINVELIDQKTCDFPVAEPIGELWKLVPVRIDINRHEIFVDNDLVIFRRIQKIDDFLNSSEKTLLMSGHSRFFGQYENLIPVFYKINSGLFGIPPNFDFGSKLKKYFLGKWSQDRNNGQFDDQGIIALSLLDNDNLLITENEIFNFDINIRKECPKNVNGLHFINANRIEHSGWTNYKKPKFL